MNMEIFLEVGLIKNENGAWKFDAAKIPAAYARIREVWLMLTDSYLKAEQEGEGSEAEKTHNERVNEWVSWTPEIRKLHELAKEGIEKYSGQHE